MKTFFKNVFTIATGIIVALVIIGGIVVAVLYATNPNLMNY